MGKKVVSEYNYKALNFNKYEFFIMKQITNNDNYISLSEIARNWVEETGKPAYRQYFCSAYKKLEENDYIEIERAESIYLKIKNRELYEYFKSLFFNLECINRELNKVKVQDAEKLIEETETLPEFKPVKL